MKYVTIPKDINDDVLFELFKFNIPLMICFTDEYNVEDENLRITIVERFYTKNDNIPIVKFGKGNKKFKDSYERIVNKINEYISSGYTFTVLTTQEVLTKKKPLFELLGKIKNDFIDGCVFIDYNYNDKYFEVRNQQTKKNNPNVLYLFESDNSLLIFDDNGPQLFVHDGINNVMDLLC